ncbi:alcohol oxidase [Phlegmacium glaucopus]|nr:alcohol oxidase [Phlegmacium glaucopus]
MLSLLVAINLACAAVVRPYEITANPSDVANRTFSYVIVGGGTAGLTIANRLTQNPKVTVLVIESGQNGQGDPRITDPGNFIIASNSPDLTWGLVTTNQTVGGLAHSLTVGKVLGGSSAINGMQWSRGTIGQYDALEELGNPGWNFRSLQGYMKKAEGFRAPNAAQVKLGVLFDTDAHGTSGHVVTGFPNPYPCPECTILDTLINATASVIPNLRTSGDIDQCSGDPRGSARNVLSLIPGASDGPNVGNNTRSSAAQSFLYTLPLTSRPNLHILVQHRATRIIWNEIVNGGLPRPQGVAFQSQDSPAGEMTINVEKEVIVSAGTLGTPKFLELSGIGNKTILGSLGIPVTVDLPAVGTNLQDQALVVSLYVANTPINSSDPHAPGTILSSFLTLPQILGKSGADSYVQELKTTISQRAAAIVASGAAVSQVGLENIFAIQAKQFGEQDAPVVEVIYGTLPQQLLGIVTWILLPQFRGTVHISSRDPKELPSLNPNYLTDVQDFSLLINASMLVRQIASTPAAKSLYSAELQPGPTVQTDSDFRTFVENNYVPVFHPIGTAAMLPRSLGGVVDAKLRVYGVQNVRVVDASIIPIQLSAHLSSTVYGIAEKASDLIIQDWSSRSQ